MGYLARTIDVELDELLPLAPAIALDGTVYVGSYDYYKFYGMEGTGGALMPSSWHQTFSISGKSTRSSFEREP